MPEIARNNNMPRQTIYQMAARRGWVVPDSTRPGRTKEEIKQDLVAYTDNIQKKDIDELSMNDIIALATRAHIEGRTGPEALIEDKQRCALIIRSILKGMPLEHAAELAGVDRKTVYRAMEVSPEFATQIKITQRQFEAARLGVIHAAERAGDAEQSWRLLKVNPATREAYGTPQERSDGKSSFEVIIHVDREGLAGVKQVAEDTITITANPTKKD